MNIAQKIKERLASNNFSVTTLEKNAGLKQGAVQNILYGRSRYPNIKIVLSIANALNCSVEDLIYKDVNNTSSQKKTEPWNQKLYLSCMMCALNYLKKEPIDMDKKTFFSCLEDIYHYSIENNMNDPDERFIYWIFSKVKKKQNVEKD